MIQTIRVDAVLREAVTTPYADLVTRRTGAEVCTRLRRRLEAQPCRAAVLDFTAVGLVDFSCADEVVAKLLLDPGAVEAPYVVLGGVSDLHREAIDHVLEWHSLAVVAIPADGGPPLLLGRVGADARRAFSRVHELGPGDTARLAEAMDWTLERAADALLTLSLLRLVQAGNGTYSPLPVPPVA